MTSYTRINIVDAEEGDQMLQAGEWVDIAAVYTMRNSSSVKVEFTGGGSMTFPREHNPATRRPTENVAEDAIGEHANAYAEDGDSRVEQLHDVLTIALRGQPVDVEWSSTGGGCMAITVTPVARPEHDWRTLLITGKTDVLTRHDWDSDDEYDGGFYVGRYDMGGEFVEGADTLIEDASHCPAVAMTYDCTCDHAHPDAAEEFTRVLRKTTVAVLDATATMLAEVAR